MEEFDTPNADETGSRKEKIAKAINQAVNPEKLANTCKSALHSTSAALRPLKRGLIACSILGLVAYTVATHITFQPVSRGETGLRINQWTGGVSRFQEGSVLVVPGLHEMRTFSLRDQEYQTDKEAKELVFQSLEGLSLNVDFSVRYALDPEKIPTMARILPEDISSEVVLPVIHNAFHRTLARYTAREIFSDRRQEIQEHITEELQSRLAGDGIKLKLLTIGKIELPFSLRDQVYQPGKGANKPVFQSLEGLSLGLDFSVRYALDLEKIPAMARILPEDIDGEVVLPIIHDAFHRTLARYTVREIFSERRQEIQEHITNDLQTRLAGEGIKLKLLTIGKVELPGDYKKGMEKLLAAEQATEQMKYTLELKDKEVKASELVAMADKVRREKAAEAAGEEQIIAAKAQAEAMKHILPFKEKQIQQRALEADADKVTRLKNAQANADARRIEAEAEADSRKKLAEAEVYRLEQIGKVNSEQMAREGAILVQSPLLIQKSLADKLSDKISVIIAPPSASGGFIAENIIGRLPAAKAPAHASGNTDNANNANSADSEEAEGE
ncbi:hypothetical protein AGMMS50256_31150 [Betaproteobacteria bacterium]|nr:hypothetical protein AGMMS50256_31150 [Betaproteobacteria bacterium]